MYCGLRQRLCAIVLKSRRRSEARGGQRKVVVAVVAVLKLVGSGQWHNFKTTVKRGRAQKDGLETALCALSGDQLQSTVQWIAVPPTDRST